MLKKCSECHRQFRMPQAAWAKFSSYIVYTASNRFKHIFHNLHEDNVSIIIILNEIQVRKWQNATASYIYLIGISFSLKIKLKAAYSLLGSNHSVTSQHHVLTFNLCWLCLCICHYCICEYLYVFQSLHHQCLYLPVSLCILILYFWHWPVAEAHQSHICAVSAARLL